MNNIITGDIFTVVSDLRTELAIANERIAQLEAHLAETWQPVANGVYDLETSGRFMVGGETLGVFKGGEGTGVDLPDNYRLCRKAATVEAEPVEWNKYDEGYGWFAVDENGEGYIYDERPTPRRSSWNNGSGDLGGIGTFNLNGTDWRATLTERPNQPKGVTRG